MPEVVFHVSYFAHFLFPVSPLPFRFFLYTLMQALLPYQDLNIAITPTNIKARTDSKYIDFISFSFEAVSTHCPPPFSVSITLFKGLFVLTSIHSPVFPNPLPPCDSIVRRTCTHTSVFGMGVIFQLPPPLIFFISTRKIKVCILYYLRLYINH